MSVLSSSIRLLYYISRTGHHCSPFSIFSFQFHESLFPLLRHLFLFFITSTHYYHFINRFLINSIWCGHTFSAWFSPFLRSVSPWSSFWYKIIILTFLVIPLIHLSMINSTISTFCNPFEHSLFALWNIAVGTTVWYSLSFVLELIHLLYRTPLILFQFTYSHKSILCLSTNPPLFSITASRNFNFFTDGSLSHRSCINISTALAVDTNSAN